MLHLLRIGREGDGLTIVIEPKGEYIEVTELLRTLKSVFGPEWLRVNDEMQIHSELTLRGELPGKDG